MRHNFTHSFCLRHWSIHNTVGSANSVFSPTNSGGGGGGGNSIWNSDYKSETFGTRMRENESSYGGCNFNFWFGIFQWYTRDRCHDALSIVVLDFFHFLWFKRCQVLFYSIRKERFDSIEKRIGVFGLNNFQKRWTKSWHSDENDKTIHWQTKTKIMHRNPLFDAKIHYEMDFSKVFFTFS